VWAEVDVQSTSDGVLLLVHDDTWKRTAGVASTVAATAWDAVQRFDAGGWFGATFRGESVPTLDDVCDFVLGRDDFQLNLEIKSPEHHRDLGPRVLAALRRRRILDRVLCTCFDAAVVEELAAAEPQLRCGYLAATPVERRHPRVHTYAIHAEALLASPAWVDRVRGEGGAIWAWTVDEPEVAATLAARGVEAIITNRPDRLLQP
jgi:glycerophosphoryl diester phosphodiesterase